jgi:hypothetical protein
VPVGIAHVRERLLPAAQQPHHRRSPRRVREPPLNVRQGVGVGLDVVIGPERASTGSGTAEMRQNG